jgi:hypothetical protein
MSMMMNMADDDEFVRLNLMNRLTKRADDIASIHEQDDHVE